LLDQKYARQKPPWGFKGRQGLYFAYAKCVASFLLLSTPTAALLAVAY
jgi:hypothetical protein